MMRLRQLVISVVFALAAGQMSYADELPVCSNRVINEVTKRIGCTLGDQKCWLTHGGFCTDYVQKMTMNKKTGTTSQWNPIQAEDVKRGDIAQFNSRAHYAYVESVVKDKNGKPVAINVSEYNYGTCWVDEELLLTEKYKIVSKRFNIPLNKVDGGFLRPQQKKDPTGSRLDGSFGRWKSFGCLGGADENNYFLIFL